MHLAGLLLFAATACFWFFYGFHVAHGGLRLAWIKDSKPARDEDCPGISLIFAARDEQDKLPHALATLAAIDYPHLEIVGVNDRSRDATPRILDDFARAHSQFRAVHVSELPCSWLGKPHALQNGYESSSGEWLLFTDADVRFAPDVLRRAVTLVTERSLDHLTLFGDVEMVGFWEKVLITFFGLAFHFATDPQRVSNPRTWNYVGVGAFQLVRRSAYEAAGTHRRLAMEIVDDMKLGKIVKRAGFRSCVGLAQGALTIRWHEGLGNLVRGVTKNFFAAAGFSLMRVVLGVTLLLLMNVAPFVVLIFAHGWIRVLAAMSVMIGLGMLAGVDVVMRVSALYAFTLPLGALLYCYMLVRSTIVTLSQGGVNWRDTFYPLDELKRGMV